MVKYSYIVANILFDTHDEAVDKVRELLVSFDDEHC